jgi:hypothetical protein
MVTCVFLQLLCCCAGCRTLGDVCKASPPQRASTCKLARSASPISHTSYLSPALAPFRSTAGLWPSGYPPCLMQRRVFGQTIPLRKAALVLPPICIWHDFLLALCSASAPPASCSHPVSVPVSVTSSVPLSASPSTSLQVFCPTACIGHDGVLALDSVSVNPSARKRCKATWLSLTARKAMKAIEGALSRTPQQVLDSYGTLTCSKGSRAQVWPGDEW